MKDKTKFGEEARLTISAQFSIKGMPPGQPGYRGGHIVFGNNRAMLPSHMLYHVAKEIVEHYAMFKDAADLNVELDEFRQAIASWKMEEKDGGT